MQQVIHSHFLQALGYAILNSLWQFALLWLLYVSINTMRKLTSHQKYITGLVLQIAGFTWFIGTLFFYYTKGLALSQTFLYPPETAFNLLNNNAVTGKEKLVLFILQTEELLPYLSLAYLALLLLLVTKCFKAYRYTQTVRKTGLEKIDVEWRLFVQQLSYKLGIDRNVKIYLSKLVITPLTIGFYKPIILIPLASINHLTAEQMEAVILHELAHIKRFDYLLNLFLTVIEAAMFFNPFMQLISIQIKRERENCCDDWVLQFEYNAASYARALLQIASSNTASPVFALKATDNKGALLSRIKRMVERKEKTFFNYKHQLLALIVMTTVLSALAVFSKKNSVFNINTNGMLTPLVARVDHPLFNPVFFLLNNDVEPGTADLNQKINEKRKDTAALQPSKSTTVRNENKSVKSIQPVRKSLFPASNLPALSREFQVAKEFAEIMPIAVVPVEDRDHINFSRESKERENGQKRLLRVVETANYEKQGVLFNSQQVLRELELAVRQLSTIKSQKEMEKLFNTAAVSIKNMATEDKIVGVRLKSESWKRIAREIQQQMEEAKNEIQMVNTNINENFEFDLRLPELSPAPTKEKVRGYSFEFSEEPVVKITAPKSYLKQTDQKNKNKKKPTGCEEDHKENLIEVAPIRNRTRPVMIIKI
jgi:beta-lactamase regulating signal transducer with metallopeptidase domain